MSWNNKVIWTEGLFLRPVHFQQQDRNVQAWIESRCADLQCYSWGITELVIDQQLLGLGKLAVSACRGVFPDGTPFSIPDQHPAPTPLEVPPEAKNIIVYLSLPVRRSSGKELAWNDQGDELSRYRMQEIEVRDMHSQSGQDSAAIQSGELWTRLRLAGNGLDAFVNIPLARILERKTDQQVVLDTQFIATCLDAKATAQLSGYIQEILGILHQRGEALAARLGSPGAGGVAEIVDLLLLQMINRFEPLFNHLASIKQLHPEKLYSIMLQMAGELATITETGHRPNDFPVYIHDELNSCFPPLAAALRVALSWVSESRAVAIPLEEHPRQIRTAIVHDRQLLKDADFVLAVNAQLPTDVLRMHIPRKTTITTVDKLRDFVMSQVPGIKLNALAVAPRQIPYHKGMNYFALDKNNSLWQELENSGTIAMHFSGEYPGLELELWAIRG